MKKIDVDLCNEIIAKKGMMTIVALSKVTKVNRWTLSKLLHSNTAVVSDETFERLFNWVSTAERK